MTAIIERSMQENFECNESIVSDRYSLRTLATLDLVQAARKKHDLQLSYLQEIEEKWLTNTRHKRQKICLKQ